MANKKFTEQEMLTLRNSKYVLDVSPSIVHFSAEFKKLFWEELSKGRLPREIVSTLGIDPNILGDSRINGLKTMIGNEVKKGNGFRDLYVDIGMNTVIIPLLSCVVIIILGSIGIC